MADITSITSLIDTFRAETEEESITPEVLGALLQKIADVVGTAAIQTDVDALATWRTTLTKIASLVSSISLGTDDANCVFINTASTNLTTGLATSHAKAITIRQATTDRAGVMTADNVTALNKCTSDIATINTTLSAINTAIASLRTSLTATNSTALAAQRTANTNATSIASLDSSLQSLYTLFRTLQHNFNTFAAMKQTSTVHIEVLIRDKNIYIQGADQLISSGLTPVIFRHTIRTSRTSETDDAGHRIYQPKRKGWHRFEDDTKLKLNADGNFSFMMERTDDTRYLKYIDTPEALFYKEKVVYDDDGNVGAVKIPFGQKLYDVFKHTRRFRFAIGFYKKTGDNKTFQFSSLRTNLAEFNVLIRAYETIAGTSYNIVYNYEMA